MKISINKYSFFLFAFIFIVTLVQAQKFGSFINYEVNIHLAALDNYQYGARTRPDRLHYGLGAGGGMSVNDEFNLLLGLDYMMIKPNNTRSDYTFCDGPSCQPEVTSHQLFLPFGFEYYSNTDRSTFQSFFNVHLIPSFSVSEKQVITPYDSSHNRLTPYEVNNSGFKFQDFSLKIGLNNEFGLSEKLKLYVEPSVRHSLLFRKEDVVNPDYTISLKIGLKFRAQKN